MNLEKEMDSGKRVFLMSLPIFLELLLQLLVGNVDQLMLSQYSQSAVAAVGNGNQVIRLVILVISTMSTATTVLISKHLGAKETQKIREICSVSLAVIGGCGVAISLFSVFAGRWALGVLGVPADALEDACAYLAIVGGFSVVQSVFLTFTAILRSYAMLKEILIASAVMNGINILGNFLLINGVWIFPRLGVVGAAISTNVSKTIGLVIIMCYLFKKTDVRFSIRNLRPFPKESLKKLLAIGLPTGMESLSYTVSQTIIFSFINTFGSAVVAAKVYCSTLANISFIYSIALAQATQIVVSYLVGAREPERVKRRVFSTQLIAIAVSFTLSLVIYLSNGTLIRIFTDVPETMALCKKVAFIELFLEIGRALNVVLVRMLIATGDVRTPVVVGIIFAWCFCMPLSYLLGIYWGYGLVGIWIVMAGDEILRGLIYLTRFLSGKWRKIMMT